MNTMDKQTNGHNKHTRSLRLSVCPYGVWHSVHYATRRCERDARAVREIQAFLLSV